MRQSLDLTLPLTSVFVQLQVKTHSSSKPLAPPVVGHVGPLLRLCPLSKAQLGGTAFLLVCG